MTILIPATTLVRLDTDKVVQAKDHPRARAGSWFREDPVRIECLSGQILHLAWNTWIRQATGLVRERVQCLSAGTGAIVHRNVRGGHVTALRTNGQWNNVHVAKRIVDAASVLLTDNPVVLDVVRKVEHETIAMGMVTIEADHLVVTGNQARHGFYVYAKERD